MIHSSISEMEEGLPLEYPVSIVMERRTSSSRWSSESWEVIGIAAGAAPTVGEPGVRRKIHEDGKSSHYLLSGFSLRLHRDECESYYHNLMTPHPRCFVVARQDEEEQMPLPFLVSMSFDEAHAYLEAGDPIYAVDVPAELYKWCEAFVLAHYVPQRKYKRKLTSWKKGA